MEFPDLQQHYSRVLPNEQVCFVFTRTCMLKCKQGRELVTPTGKPPIKNVRHNNSNTPQQSLQLLLLSVAAAAGCSPSHTGPGCRAASTQADAPLRSAAATTTGLHQDKINRYNLLERLLLRGQQNQATRRNDKKSKEGGE